MMFNDNPLAYFITWTVYGTFLQGDNRWWRKRGSGSQPSQPLLEQWHRERLKHEIILLNESHRGIVEKAIQRHCTTNISFWLRLSKQTSRAGNIGDGRFG